MHSMKTSMINVNILRKCYDTKTLERLIELEKKTCRQSCLPKTTTRSKTSEKRKKEREHALWPTADVSRAEPAS